MWKPPGLRRLSELPQWHVQSQQVARRNALVACTALAARRKERRDVEDFFSDLGSRRSAGQPAGRIPRQRGAG